MDDVQPGDPTRTARARARRHGAAAVRRLPLFRVPGSSPPASPRRPATGTALAVTAARAFERCAEAGLPRLPRSVGDSRHPLPEYIMLRWALVFAVIAIIAGLLGFTGIAAGAASIAKLIFFVFVVLLVLALVLGSSLFKR
jgi:uncharacterized membrane protein YtjA (UPF0391 family)